MQVVVAQGAPVQQDIMPRAQVLPMQSIICALPRIDLKLQEAAPKAMLHPVAVQEPLLSTPPAALVKIPGSHRWAVMAQVVVMAVAAAVAALVGLVTTAIAFAEAMETFMRVRLAAAAVLVDVVRLAVMGVAREAPLLA